MIFSKTCEYAIKIMIHLSFYCEKDELLGVKDISRSIDSPEPFTGKILQQLVKSGLLHSIKGKKGGFIIDKNPKEIKIHHIAIAIDGNKLLDECILGLKGCSSDNPCPLHHKFYKIKDQIKNDIMNSNLKELKNYLEQKKYTFLLN